MKHEHENYQEHFSLQHPGRLRRHADPFHHRAPGLFDLDLSDTFRRVLGGLNLVGIGALAYSGMKLRNGNDQKQ